MGLPDYSERKLSVGKRRGVLINKTGGKVIQIEVRKGWWDGELDSAWLPQQLCRVGLGLGSRVGTAARMHHPADGKVVTKPFPGSLGSLFPCRAVWSSHSSGGAEPQPCPQ